MFDSKALLLTASDILSWCYCAYRSSSYRRGSHALVMEAGEEDLVGLIKRQGVQSFRDIKK